jgi:signal transduction histidine kinase
VAGIYDRIVDILKRELRKMMHNEDIAEHNSLLIVDDDKSNLLVLINILQSDYTVYTAKDGEEAIKKAENYLPDLILLDIILPGIDGYEAFARLKKSSNPKAAEIPVVFITGFNESSGEEKGLALGAVDYIPKPFNPMVVKLKVMHQIRIINLKRSLEAAVIEAQAANNTKSRFLSNMSHEMRTPMNVMMGLTDLMLEDENLQPATKENLEKINVAGKTLLSIMNDILAISKIETGKLDLMPVQYDVPSLLNDIITFNIIRIEDRPVIFKLVIKEDLFSNLFGDDLRVKQILNNLLSNAFKYTEKGTVTLSVAINSADNWHNGDGRSPKESLWLSFTVSDTGIGIRKEDMSKIFANYNQIDFGAKRGTEGTGLGLSITKKFVELMDGEISVESEYGKGSTFRVRIRQGFVDNTPIGKETMENLCHLRYSDKKTGTLQKLVRPDLSYARVLVVDDFTTNLDLASGMLRKYKMQVDCLKTGQEAVDRIAAGEPIYDAVFMDHMMPEMDGVEATKLIRALGTKYAKNLQIIALTANAIPGNEQMFLDNGFNAFLPKPFSAVTLDSVIQRMIRDNSKGTDNSAP